MVELSERSSWLQFSAALALFLLLVITVLFKPQLGPGLNFSEVRAAIWATIIILMPAMMLAPYSTWSRVIANLSGFCWTFGMLMFLFHLYLGVFTVFDGVADTVRRVGAFSASFVLLLIGWWCLDVIGIWLFGHSRRGIRSAHVAAQIFVFFVFAGGLLSHDGPVQKLGLVFAMGVLASLAVRMALPERAVRARSTGFALERSITSVGGGMRRRYQSLLERERHDAPLPPAPVGRGEIRSGRAETRMQPLRPKQPVLPPG